jgi:hypothetical protein
MRVILLMYIRFSCSARLSRAPESEWARLLKASQLPVFNERIAANCASLTPAIPAMQGKGVRRPILAVNKTLVLFATHIPKSLKTRPWPSIRIQTGKSRMYSMSVVCAPS